MGRWVKFHSMTFSSGKNNPYEYDKKEAEKAHRTWHIKTLAQEREAKSGSRETLISFLTSSIIRQALQRESQVPGGRGTDRMRMLSLLQPWSYFLLVAVC